jgi:hypothetical protein
MKVFETSNAVVYSVKTRAFKAGADDAFVRIMLRQYMSWMRSPGISDSSTVWGLAKFKSGGLMQFNGQCTCAEPSCRECNAAIARMERSVFGGCDGINV